MVKYSHIALKIDFGFKHQLSVCDITSFFNFSASALLAARVSGSTACGLREDPAKADLAALADFGRNLDWPEAESTKAECDQ